MPPEYLKKSNKPALKSFAVINVVVFWGIFVSGVDLLTIPDLWRSIFRQGRPLRRGRAAGDLRPRRAFDGQRQSSSRILALAGSAPGFPGFQQTPIERTARQPRTARPAVGHAAPGAARPERSLVPHLQARRVRIPCSRSQSRLASVSRLDRLRRRLPPLPRDPHFDYGHAGDCRLVVPGVPVPPVPTHRRRRPDLRSPACMHGACHRFQHLDSSIPAITTLKDLIRNGQTPLPQRQPG